MENQIVIPIPSTSHVDDEVRNIVHLAGALVIATPEHRASAAEFERGLIRREKAIIEHYRPIKQSLDAHKKVIIEQERSYLAPVNEARGILRQKQLAWDTEQQRLADEEAKKAEAELRVRAEERRLAEAHKQREAGNAAQAIATLEAPVEVPAVRFEAPKMAGQSVRTTWKADVTDRLELVKFVANNPAMLHLIEPNMTALNAMARDQKDALNVPGVKARAEKSITTRL